MSSGQESIIAKDLSNHPTRGLGDLNRPSSETSSNSLKPIEKQVVVEKPVVVEKVVEKPVAVEKPISEKFKDAVHEATATAHEYAEAAEDKAFKLKDKAKEYMNESSVKAREYTLDAQIKGAVLADRAHRAVSDKVEEAKEYASKMGEGPHDHELRESQQKAVSAGKRMENALNSLIDATGEALKNLGVKETEHGEYKNTDKSVDFSRGVRDQTAHSAPRIHDPAIVNAPTSDNAKTSITSSEPFAPTENTTAVSESSFVPPSTTSDATTTTTTTTTTNDSSSNSGGITGFLASIFRTSSPAPDVSADSFEQPLTSERSFVAEHDKRELREPVVVPEATSELTAERAYGAEQEAKEEMRETTHHDTPTETTHEAPVQSKSSEEPGLLTSLADTARAWAQGTEVRTDEEAKSTRQSDFTKTNQP